MNRNKNLHGHYTRLLYVLYLQGYQLFKMQLDYDMEAIRINSLYEMQFDKEEIKRLSTDEKTAKNIEFYSDVIVFLMQEDKLKIAKFKQIIIPSGMTPISLFLEDMLESLSAKGDITLISPIKIGNLDVKELLLGNI